MFGFGYYVYNDQAVAPLHLFAASMVEIIDLDAHQDDGSAANPSVFLSSMHRERIFPFGKFPVDLEVALPDGSGNEYYLRALPDQLPTVFEFRPDFILYQAGVDPMLEVSRDGLS